MHGKDLLGRGGFHARKGPIRGGFHAQKGPIRGGFHARKGPIRGGFNAWKGSIRGGVGIGGVGIGRDGVGGDGVWVLCYKVICGRGCRSFCIFICKIEMNENRKTFYLTL